MASETTSRRAARSGRAATLGGLARRGLGACALALGAIPLAFGARPAESQLPNPDPRALGMGGNHTALARGYAAVTWNPALLGLPDGEAFTIALAPVTGGAGIGPVTWRHLTPFVSDTVPRGERERWLALVEDEGRQQGDVGGEVTLLSASMGRFALQVSSVAHADASLAPGAAELVLFGNVGLTGEPCVCLLDGTALDGHVVSTGALSMGLPIGELFGGSAAAGVTLKYSVGHALVHGLDLGSSVGPNPTIDVTFPLIATDTAADFGNAGSGVGLDVGFALRRDDLTFGANLRNVLQTFQWDVTKLRFREGRAVLSRDVQDAELSEAPFESAPEGMQRFVADRTFARTLSLGAALEATDALTVAGDLHVRLVGEGMGGMEGTPALHVGAGAEYRLSALSLRGGAAALSGGYQLGGGVGLELGPVRLGAAVLRRKTGAGSDLVAMLTLLSAGW